jgi:hypothetical protein
MKHRLNTDEKCRAKAATVAKNFLPSLPLFASRDTFLPGVSQSVFHPCFIRG